MKRINPFPMDDYEFGLCLTHDVDRPYKDVQSLFYAATEGDLSHLSSLKPGNNPWWQFETITELESSFGVRSAFYFLSEQHLFRERSVDKWLDSTYWIEHVSRYDPGSPAVADVIQRLDDGGWEVGVHGSLGTHEDPDRLAAEKDVIEEVLGHEVVGGRQHHLRLDVPNSWEHHVDVGLSYDASLGSNSRVGFQHGSDLLRPFDDDFVVFPLTVMDTALMNVATDIADARARLDRLLERARDRNAVMTAVWHPRNFSRADYPGQRDLYRHLIAEAQQMGAWVGAPATLYDKLPTEDAQPEQRTEPHRAPSEQ